MKGTVVKAYGRYYDVSSGDGVVRCTLRGKLRKTSDLARYSNPVAVGDLVSLELDRDGGGTISEIHHRNNIFSRKDKGRNKKEDIIAANLDLIVVIQSFYRPRLNLRFVDRLAVRGRKDGVPALLCLNKLDLADDGDVEFVKDYYSRSGMKLVFTSALTGEGLDLLKESLLNKTSILAGYSGAGKSTILNAIFPHLDLRVADVSDKTGKGRHTTTNVEMIVVDGENRIIDTPGMREFGLMDIEPHTLGNYFVEFRKYSSKCAFNPCTHDHEPDCEVRRQVDRGRIHAERYVSYLNILESLKEYYERRY